MLASRADSRRRLRRLAIVGVFGAITASAPVLGGLAGPSGPPPQPVAGCLGQGVPLGLNAVGAQFTDNCDLVVTPPAVIGAAPSAGAIIACRNIPGCLSQWVNNPGLVRVPNVDTSIRHR
jgi:hypothetical protein